MKASTPSLVDHLRALLAQGGVLTAPQLQQATGKSQPSISLALGRLETEVCKIGAARSTRYALVRPILGLAARQTLTWTTPAGVQQPFGELTFLHTGQVHIRAEQGWDWLGSAGQLPWFLQTLQPQGFLGRQLARLRPDFAADPDQWSIEQVLYMATNHANDPPGAIHMGPVMGRLMQEAPHPLAERAAAFDAMANAIHTTLPAASSAGGEQPKFTTELSGTDDQYKHLIVKFSPPRGTPFGERWHDLLHLEHLALQVLAEQGVAVATTHLLESPERTYLISERFDRVGLEGKRHVVAAAAVRDAFAGARTGLNWITLGEVLSAQGLLSEDHLRNIAAVFLFGQYIGNTDMHHGNLSFLVEDVMKPILVPTPVYDMLPMLWRPGIHSGELSTVPVAALPQPTGYAAQAALAKKWAQIYWERATDLAALSPALREASAINRARLA